MVRVSASTRARAGQARRRGRPMFSRVFLGEDYYEAPRARVLAAHTGIREGQRDVLALLPRALIPAQRGLVVALDVALAVAVDVAEPFLRRPMAAHRGLLIGLHRRRPVAPALELARLPVARCRNHVRAATRALGRLRPDERWNHEEQPGEGRGANDGLGHAGFRAVGVLHLPLRYHPHLKP